MTETINTPVYEDDVRELVSIQAEKQRLTAREGELKKKLRELPKGTHEISGCKVQVQANRRVNLGRVKEAFPVGKYAPLGYYKPAEPDMTEIKKHIAPSELEKFYDEGENKVVVK